MKSRRFFLQQFSLGLFFALFKFSLSENSTDYGIAPSQPINNNAFLILEDGTALLSISEDEDSLV
ncbi:MAG: hypothetical protein J0M08_05045 [Bacteroidetes bacterium]|nr:hypothetical protein [Bacteroidota bacterium]